MADTRLVATFEMLVERLTSVEQKQDKILRAIREADLAKGQPYISSAVHWDTETPRSFKIFNKSVSFPIVSNDLIKIDVDTDVDFDLFALCGNCLNEWDIDLDLTKYPLEIQDSLKKVMATNAATIEYDKSRGEAGSDLINPRMEELNLFKGTAEGALQVERWVIKEALQEHVARSCEILHAHDYDGIFVRFPKASRREPVELTDVLDVIEVIKKAVLKSSRNAPNVVVGSVTMTQVPPGWLRLYILLAQDQSDDCIKDEVDRMKARLGKQGVASFLKGVDDEESIVRFWRNKLKLMFLH